MSGDVTVNNLRKLRILVAPLDWGLGHATRCIPIVHELIRQGCEPVIATSGPQARLLSLEFPNLSFVDLKGYNVSYSRGGSIAMALSMLRQSRKIMRAISLEHDWLKTASAEFKLDGVISDNRFGLWHESLPSAFLTHQLSIAAPILRRSLQSRNYRFINRFSECWVPDVKEEGGIAGDLSHPDQLPKIPVHYVGPLSRFSPSQIQSEKERLLILLSGPEPQRTILEEKILAEIRDYEGTATLVRGLPANERLIPSSEKLQFFNHLGTDELSKEIQRASLVICRSGYSTIMDLMALRKESFLIPTPGQTEQEYLAGHLSDKGFAPFISQRKFALQKAIELSKEYNYAPLERMYSDGINLRGVMKNFLEKIRSSKKETISKQFT